MCLLTPTQIAALEQRIARLEADMMAIATFKETADQALWNMSIGRQDRVDLALRALVTRVYETQEATHQIGKGYNTPNT